MSASDQITFVVQSEDDGGYSAYWDDPNCGGISTQSDSLDTLRSEILDAVRCHFDEQEHPAKVFKAF